MTTRALRIATLSVVHAASAALGAAHAQLIAVKTAPISDGGQFAFLPSSNMGLGGLSIALADNAFDPFVNPAKGARLSGARVFGAPTFFSTSRNAGGGTTLHVGTSASTGPWFTQFVVAMQEIEEIGDGQQFIPAVDVIGAVPGPNGSFVEAEVSRQNRYVHGMLGRRLANRLSVAASASWWRLNAIDGVELYYPGSQFVRQHGEAADLRLGVLKELGRGQSIEAVAVHNRYAVNQDVSFTDIFWNPNLRQMTFLPRTEPNADRVESWGLHLGYTRPLADSTWRVGAILTGNRILQPRLPAYDLPQVPGDAGRANALNVGAGVSRTKGPWTIGLDAIYEPIWNRTWVSADVPVETLQGTTLNAGATTLENQFDFSNGIVRLGVGAAVPLAKDYSLMFETGGQLHAIRYRLDQQDAIRSAHTSSTQHWNEWTRSWGVSLRLATADLRYRGRLTTGARRPGFDEFGGVFLGRPLTAESSFAPIAPAGLLFDKVRATTHQISLSVPIR